MDGPTSVGTDRRARFLNAEAHLKMAETRKERNKYGRQERRKTKPERKKERQKKKKRRKKQADDSPIFSPFILSVCESIICEGINPR